MGPSRSNAWEYSRSPPSVCRDAAPFAKPVSRKRPSGPERPRCRCITASSSATHDRPRSRTPVTGIPSGSTVRPVRFNPGPSSTTAGVSSKRSNTDAFQATWETRTAERSRSDRVRLTLPSASEIPKPRGSDTEYTPKPGRTRYIRAPARGAPAAVACTVNSTASCSASSTELSSGFTSRQVEARPPASPWTRHVSSLRSRESDPDSTVVDGSRSRGTSRHIATGAATTSNPAAAAVPTAGSPFELDASGTSTRIVSGLEEAASARQPAAAFCPGSRSRGGHEELHAQQPPGSVPPSGRSSSCSHALSAGTGIPSRKAGALSLGHTNWNGASGASS